MILNNNYNKHSSFELGDIYINNLEIIYIGLWVKSIQK